jgi:predicted Fe-Mo cluster-binding NifX family protein
MNIAIPVYENRVMPRFGCTREMIIIKTDGGKIVAEERLTLKPESFFTLPLTLTTAGVSVMICGGIHPRFQQVFQEHEIQLIKGVIGEWEDVVQAYLHGTLQTHSQICRHHGYGQNHRFRKGQQRRK